MQPARQDVSAQCQPMPAQEDDTLSLRVQSVLPNWNRLPTLILDVNAAELNARTAFVLGWLRVFRTTRYHTDPSGTYVKYQAMAIGSGSEGAQTALQEQYKCVRGTWVADTGP